MIFDENYERKPAYYALRDAIATQAMGGVVGGNVLMEEVGENGERWGEEWMPSQDKSDSNDGEVSGDMKPDWLQSSN